MVDAPILNAEGNIIRVYNIRVALVTGQQLQWEIKSEAEMISEFERMKKEQLTERVFTFRPNEVINVDSLVLMEKDA